MQSMIMLISIKIIAASFLVPLLLIIVAGQNCGCAYIVSQEFVDELMSHADPNCDGNGFYTRDVFLNAWQSFSSFAESPSIDDSK
ncbi:hypothetical protein IEQ34_010913 [Dendrobium chrysotoxum]|uniref:chitinase n=1 Tax=Dendrobium chrysotoxum TaxID=161865 RepID=A0AAV7GYC5_DENCH|nr:hypothetical protein IEQ34_010913 [Dendrobium chrysotoxum]